MPFDQQSKKGIVALGREIDPYEQGEIGLLLHNENEKDYVARQRRCTLINEKCYKYTSSSTLAFLPADESQSLR